MSDFEKPDKKAAALHYDGKNTPTVTAAASGVLAEEIIEIARQHDIPLFENEALLKLLVDIGVGEEIPETLYLCIAQVIAFAYKVQGKYPKGWDSISETIRS
ncbi:MAG: flagellar biosynthesis protein FlhB [Oceanicoccus sp.]|uniref:EscU/YscU/HrcU family type III secretion system export apparatus switch protein n=1 Tax=Oceanicoccus sp. TaxID=2691044 RepID=UPI00260C8F61|nr:EscU/YscU/HrcU family type III secretion system export apparatus switch protein [Oceanicoccus sp.]MCP3909101.1 flagellar biosynthesis protein FlhB [Oceanicoccus sp.]MDG1773540.1 EscU/YscU/HrcU family type III secretion system export apparatus switch protein [Oceanicoccus sp.]